MEAYLLLFLSLGIAAVIVMVGWPSERRIVQMRAYEDDTGPEAFDGISTETVRTFLELPTYLKDDTEGLRQMYLRLQNSARIVLAQRGEL